VTGTGQNGFRKELAAYTQKATESPEKEEKHKKKKKAGVGGHALPWEKREKDIKVLNVSDSQKKPSTDRGLGGGGGFKNLPKGGGKFQKGLGAKKHETFGRNKNRWENNLLERKAKEKKQVGVHGKKKKGGVAKNHWGNARPKIRLKVKRHWGESKKRREEEKI